MRVRTLLVRDDFGHRSPMPYTLIIREIDWPGLTVQCRPTVRLSSTPTDSPNGPLDPDLDLQSLRACPTPARELPEDRSE